VKEEEERKGRGRREEAGEEERRCFIYLAFLPGSVLMDHKYSAVSLLFNFLQREVSGMLTAVLLAIYAQYYETFLALR
jgi:hypothetical protein